MCLELIFRAQLICVQWYSAGLTVKREKFRRQVEIKNLRKSLAVCLKKILETVMSSPNIVSDKLNWISIRRFGGFFEISRTCWFCFRMTHFVNLCIVVEYLIKNQTKNFCEISVTSRGFLARLSKTLYSYLVRWLPSSVTQCSVTVHNRMLWKVSSFCEVSNIFEFFVS